MGWTNWPPTSTTDVQAYDWLIQAWTALRLRHNAIGTEFWPFPDDGAADGDQGIWDRGTVTGATLSGSSIDVTMTITDAWTPAAFHSSPRWVDYQCTGSTTQCCASKGWPRFYDLIIELEPNNPLAVIRCPITAQSGSTPGGTGTLTVDATNALNAIAANWMDNVGDFEGKPYYIIGRGKTWWSDRWPEVRNAQETWIGNCTSSTGTRDADTGDSTTYLKITDTDPTTAWGDDWWAPDPTGETPNQEVLVYSGDRLYRLPILHNDGNTLYVAPVAGITPAGVYSIVDAGNIGQPGRTAWKPFQWYTGNADANYSHTADDAIATTKVPATSYLYSSGNNCGGGTCADFTASIFDIDFHVGCDEVCAGSLTGTYLNRDLYKSIRGLQNDILNICSAFVPIQSYDGATAINLFTPASLLYKLGINAGSSTTDYDGTNIYFTVSESEYWGRSIYYEVFDTAGKHKGGGTGTVSSDGVVSPVDGCGYTDADHNDTGLNVVYSAGLTRWRPRWFKYLYPKTCFIPDTGSDPVMAYDPPTVSTDEHGNYDCSTKGTWVRRGKSTGGVVANHGQPLDSAEDFIAGEVYRYTGDNFRDTFPYGYTPSDSDARLLLLPYEDRFFRGNLSTGNQAARDASRRGTVTASTTYSITQADSDWWSDWANGGTLRTESGTATGGSSTTLVDATKDTTDPTLPWSCWFAPDRFATGDDPYVGFILEITSHTTGQVTKMPITGCATGAGGVTFTFSSAAGITVSAGDTYQIREPKYELNKWEGRTLTATTPTGSTIGPITITQSDDRSLYFAPQAAAIPVGSTIVIGEDRTGGVYKWDGSQMVVATGADTVRPSVTVPQPFKSDPTLNNEGWVKDYGVWEFGDMVCTPVFAEIYAMLDALRWTLSPLSWTSEATPGTPEQNFLNSLSHAFGFNTDPTAVPSDPPPYQTSYNPDYSTNENQMWGALFDSTSPFNATYAKSENDGAAPRQWASTSVGYAYENYGATSHSENIYGPDQDYMQGESAYAYGKLTGVRGLKWLNATIEGMVFCGIDPSDSPEQESVDTSTEAGVSLITKYHFDPAGSGTQYHKWTDYASWSVSASDANDVVIGPRFGSTDFVGNPSLTEQPYSSAAEEQFFVETGEIGWAVINAAAIIKWDFNGY